MLEHTSRVKLCWSLPRLKPLQMLYLKGLEVYINYEELSLLGKPVFLMEFGSPVKLVSS